MSQQLRDTARQVRGQATMLQTRSEALILRARGIVALSGGGNSAASVKMAALEKEVENLRIAPESRATIEQAKGIVMAALACSADEAFHVLVQQSQHENRKLREVANDLVLSKQRRRN